MPAGRAPTFIVLILILYLSLFYQPVLRKKIPIRYLNLLHIQLRAKQTAPLVNKHYQNEVTLTGQNPPLKCCQPLEILTHFITGLDLSMIEIWQGSRQGSHRTGARISGEPRGSTTFSLFNAICTSFHLSTIRTVNLQRQSIR